MFNCFQRNNGSKYQGFRSIPDSPIKVEFYYFELFSYLLIGGKTILQNTCLSVCCRIPVYLYAVEYLLFCYQSEDNKTNQYNQNPSRSGSLGYIATLGEYSHSLSGSINHQVSVVQSTKDKDH